MMWQVWCSFLGKNVTNINIKVVLVISYFNNEIYHKMREKMFRLQCAEDSVMVKHCQNKTLDSTISREPN